MLQAKSPVQLWDLIYGVIQKSGTPDLGLFYSITLFTRREFIVVTVKELLKLVYFYQSYLTN